MPEFETVHGILYYETLGGTNGSHDTEPAWLTLLHNFMSTGQSAWGIVADTLSDQYRILLPDLPGHGQSVGRSPAFQHLEMARQIANLMHSIGADSGHLAGASAGGIVAELMVEHELIAPSTLTLVSSTYSVDSDTTGVKTGVRPEQFRAGERWLDATARLHDPYRYEGYFEDVLLNRFQRLEPSWVIDLQLEDLAAWAMPVCLVHGDEDEFFPVTIAEQMAEALPDAELHVVADQGHSLLFERPARVAAILDDFLARHPVVTGGQGMTTSSRTN